MIKNDFAFFITMDLKETINALTSSSYKIYYHKALKPHNKIYRKESLSKNNLKTLAFVYPKLLHHSINCIQQLVIYLKTQPITKCTTIFIIQRKVMVLKMCEMETGFT